MHPATGLLRRILVLNAAMEFEMRRAMGVNETDFQAMQHLMPVTTMSPGELASLMHLTSAAVTSIIDRLVKAGHVERSAHPTDRRKRLISVTTGAKRDAMLHLMPMIMESDASVRAMDPAAQEAVERYLLATADAMERRTLYMQAHNSPTNSIGKGKAGHHGN